jgi:hypothetical protein
MKKLFYSIALVASLALFSSQGKAATTNFTLVVAGYTNLFIGSATVTQIILSPAVASTAASAKIIDANQVTNQFYTNAAYIQTYSYVTNYTTNWTDYFGNTDSWTNRALVTITNTAPATTNMWPVRLALVTATNGTTTLGGVNYYFNRGFAVTNTGPAALNISVTYQQ